MLPKGKKKLAPKRCMSQDIVPPSSAPVKSLRHLKQLHAHLIRRTAFQASHHHPAALLLARCAEVGAPLSYARHLFESIRQPDARSFSSILKLCSRCGAQNDAVAIFRRMCRLSVRPHVPSVFPAVIKSLGPFVACAHALVLKLGHGPDTFVRNAVMSSYAHHGPIEAARRLFDEMPDKAVADWNAMLAGYWKWGRKEEAMRTFNLMPGSNVVSWTAMVTGLSRFGDLEAAQMLFDSMAARNVISWNAMLSGYVQNGLVEQGLRLFHQMISAGVHPNETTWVSIIAACAAKGDLKLAESLVGSVEERLVHTNCYIKTALIDMYARCGSLAKARQIFDEMEDRNLVAWNTMIAAHAKQGQLDEARDLFDTMHAKDVISWNTLMSSYTQNSQWGLAIELFKEMIVKSYKPDEVTMSSVISACGHLGYLEFGRWLVKYMDENQIKHSTSVSNSLIFMYSSCGSMEDARRAFEEMPRRDVTSYNSLISGYAANGNGHESITLLEKMEEEGAEPNSITYLAVLTACSHAGLTQEGCKVFEMIKGPCADHYACKVDLLGRAGKLDEAKKVIEDIPVHPHAGVYSSLLNACQIHRRVELGEFAAKELLKLEPEDAGNYILLSNFYSSARKWEFVDNVRRGIRERGVDKVSGCSWIELKGDVNQFVAGDRSHWQSDEIHKVLIVLGRMMR